MNLKALKTVVLASVTTTAFLAAILLVSPALTSAEGGVSISPAFQDITVLATDDRVSGEFTVSNNDSEPLRFGITAIDMGSLDESGGIVFSGLDSDYQQKYGLAKWLDVGEQKYEVGPGKEVIVEYDIVNSDDFSPGGHYGAIIIQPELGSQSREQGEVSVSPQAATLLFVKKVGGEIYGLRLDSIKASSGFWSRSKTVSVDLYNNGNVHVVPRGVAHMKSSSGEIVAKAVINSESSLVLPERTRTYTSQWQYLTGRLWPGKYTIEVNYRYDGEEEFAVMTTEIRIINFWLVLRTIVFLILLGLLIRWIYDRYQRPLSRIIGKLKKRRSVKIFGVTIYDKPPKTRRPKSHGSLKRKSRFDVWPARGQNAPEKNRQNKRNSK